MFLDNVKFLMDSVILSAGTIESFCQFEPNKLDLVLGYHFTGELPPTFSKIPNRASVSKSAFTQAFRWIGMTAAL